MFMQMLRTVRTEVEIFREGVIYEVGPRQAARWEAEGKAKPTTAPPPAIAGLLDRLNDGADKPCIFMPPVGQEFGHEVMSTLRLVHFHAASRKVVCCRPGTEAFYPCADEHVTDWQDPIPDAERIGTLRNARVEYPEILARYPDHHPVYTGGLTFEQEMCAVRPTEPISFKPKPRGLRADVLLGVRERALGPERNWGKANWEWLAWQLWSLGYTFAVVGRRDTSYDIPGQKYHTGDYDADATLELMQNCKLYIGTDTGSSHLAATARAPMLIFRQEMQSPSRMFIERMQMVNAPGNFWFCPTGWENPMSVFTAASLHLESRS